MKQSTALLACLATGFASQAGAQSVSPAFDAWMKSRHAAPTATTAVPPTGEQRPLTADVAEQAPAYAATPVAQPAQDASSSPAPATSATTTQVAVAPPPPAQTPRRKREEPRAASGAFIGAQAGKGWVYEDIDQNLYSVNAGYRWRAGPVTQIGIEAAVGKLDRVSDHDGYYAPDVDFYSLGGTARFNFGRNNPWFALARLGYWSGKTEFETFHSYDFYGNPYYEMSRERVYGAYAGFGIGVDLGRHTSLSLNYTGYVYSNSYTYDDYEVNYADTVNLGVEVRF